MTAMHYHRPTSVADAVKLLGEHADDKLLAGGQSMLPSLKMGLLSTDGFIDLGGIKELKGISVDGAGVRIGAMTTHAEVAASKEVQAKIPALAALAAGIGTSGMPIASQIALMSAAGAPIAPASPQPFTPSGLCVHGVPGTIPIVKLGRSSARGMA